MPLASLTTPAPAGPGAASAADEFHLLFKFSHLHHHAGDWSAAGRQQRQQQQQQPAAPRAAECYLDFGELARHRCEDEDTD